MKTDPANKSRSKAILANKSLKSQTVYDILPKLLARLRGIRRINDRKYQACCPAHEDKTPSLTISAKDDKLLLHCFAGCTQREVVDALGLEMKDLFVKSARDPNRPIRPRDDVGKLLCAMRTQVWILAQCLNSRIAEDELSTEDVQLEKAAMEKIRELGGRIYG